MTDFAAILACPRCRGSLGKAARSWDCASCGARWPIVKGIPRFVDSEHYVGSFGWEWRRHKRTQIDDASSRESEETFAAKTGLSPSDVKGKVVLDVGVGSGRFSHVVARWGGIPVGVDLSLAVLSAHANLAPFAPEALVVQGDAFTLPFREEAFDHVFSIGVLHHTPSTLGAFQRVARFVKPGGTVAIALYEKTVDLEHSGVYRRYTTELPHSLLHFLSHAAIPMPHVLQAVETAFGTMAAVHLHRALFTNVHRDARWRVLDTFDWYSPRYQWLHEEEEVKAWFTELGFLDVRRLPERTMVSVRGTRGTNPLPAPAPLALGGASGSAVPEGPCREARLLAHLGLEVGRALGTELGLTLRHELRPWWAGKTERFLWGPVSSAVVKTKRSLGLERGGSRG